MRTILLVLTSFALSFLLNAQNHPGFYYQDSTYTSVGQTEIRSDGSIVAPNTTSQFLWLGRSDSVYQNISIINPSLSQRDTIIWMQNDTSSKYFLGTALHFMLDDTSYFFGGSYLRNSTMIPFSPSNFTFWKLTPDNTIIPARYLFESDTLGYFPYFSTADLTFNSRLGLFEILQQHIDSAGAKMGVALMRFNRQGELKYFKKWDYTYQWTMGLYINDFHPIGQGKYLVVQPNLHDAYFIADTAMDQIDTAYTSDPIRGFFAITELDDAYLLFGKSDGYSYQSLQNGKAQYMFYELNKSDLSERSRSVIKLKDTLVYDQMRINVFQRHMVRLSNGDFIFTSIEAGDPPMALTQIFMGIYRVDSAYNIKWSYKIADTTYQESFGLPQIAKIPGNSSELLWYSSYCDQPMFVYGEVWMRKIKVDGSNLGLSEDELESAPAFKMFPNPANDRVSVLLPFLPDNDVVAKIYSLDGAEMHAETFSKRDNLLRLEMELKSGVYLLKVTSGRYSHSEKLIIE